MLDRWFEYNKGGVGVREGVNPESITAATLHVDHLRVGYGRRRMVIDGLTWAVPAGRVGLLGPNGAGKSTLIKAMTGELIPSGGSVTVAGAKAQDAPVIGYVPQGATLPGHMRVRDAVQYVAWMNGVSEKDLATHAASALRKVELLEQADCRVRQLSGGQRQRVALACGMVREPSVLILDEPTAGLDPAQRMNIRKAIAALDPACLILATHLLEDVEYLCDHVAVLIGGMVRWTGTLDGFKQELSHHAGAAAYGSPLEVAYEEFIESLGEPGSNARSGWRPRRTQ